MDRDTSGWERGKEMRRWRDRKGGAKARKEGYLSTRLGMLADDWLKAQGRSGLAKGTIKTRRGLVRRFLDWCSKREISEPEWLSSGLLYDWVAWLDDYRTRINKPLAESTKEGMMRAVNTFMQYLLDHRVIEANPMEGFRIRRCRGRPIPHVMAESEVAALLVAPNTSDLLGLRDRAMLELLYSSGLRRAELATLEVEDLRMESGVVIVKHGKGGKERIAPIGRVAIYWLQRYLREVRPEMIVEGVPCPYVFLTSYGDRWSVGSLGQVVRKYLDEIGLQMSGSCHLLRHACATHMINHGSDLVAIKSILGHARIDTTEIYTHVSTDRVLEVHKGAHPRG